MLFTFGLFWRQSSIFGAWAAMIVGGLTWFVYYLMDTIIDPTLIGTPASVVAMVVGSVMKPDPKKSIEVTQNKF